MNEADMKRKGGTSEAEGKDPLEIGNSDSLRETLDLGDITGTNLDQLIDKFLGPLADDYSIRILSATRKEGKTVRELSRELDIPIATCYRRVKELVDANLLEVEDKRLTKEGKRATVLRANVSYVQISFEFEDQELKVSIEPTGK